MLAIMLGQVEVLALLVSLFFTRLWEIDVRFINYIDCLMLLVVKCTFSNSSFAQGFQYKAAMQGRHV